MANKNLTDLTARTATADSDLIHVNSGGTDYKETKRDFLQGDFYITFGNTSTLTSQIDALPSLGTWFGRITGYGAQSATGLPINANCNIEARKYNGNYVEVDCFPISATVDEQYRLTKVNGTWQSWVKLPTRSEITSINSSLTKSFLTVTPSADVTIVRCTACVVAKTLIMNGVITTTAAKATGTTLLTLSNVTIHNTTDFFAGTAGTILPFYLATNGEVKCNAAAPAGNYFFNLSAVVYG